MAKKKKKAKFPKRIAGVKVPRMLRKAGPSLAAALNTPAGREALAAGLMAMAAALAGTKRGRDSVAQAEEAVGEAGSAAATKATSIGEAAIDAVADVARAVLSSPKPAADLDGKRGKRKMSTAAAASGRRTNADEIQKH